MEEAVLNLKKEMVVNSISISGNQQHGHDHWEEALELWINRHLGSLIQKNTNEAEENSTIYKGLHNQTPGFMVLGMHRSGTSMLSGLLAQGFGLITKKGFTNVVTLSSKNDEWFYAQNMHWAANVYHYNSEFGPPQTTRRHHLQRRQKGLAIPKQSIQAITVSAKKIRECA
ncbi:hypothetical protein ACHAWO_002322 [Cyclotella atomus]|uniref:Protein-tyrosine sulfotransferase n=1 Tax=Cyclotella atomus TaxID=382360 RepID=A0ABD3Q1U2_9STRA